MRKFTEEEINNWWDSSFEDRQKFLAPFSHEERTNFYKQMWKSPRGKELEKSLHESMLATERAMEKLMNPSQFPGCTCCPWHSKGH